MSFDGKIQWYNGNRSNPSGTITVEFPTVGDSSFVYKVLNTNQNTDMTFGIFMDIYEDGFPRKRLRLNDSTGTPIVLTAQSATATTGSSEKSNPNPTPSAIGPDFAIKYTAIWGLLNSDKPAILDSTRQSDYADALEWSSVDLYLPSDDELGMTFYGDSRYGYNIFVEPLDGKMYFQTINAWLPKTSSGGTPSLPTGVHHFVSDSHRSDLLGESFIKKTVSSFSGTALNIECKADRDFNPYFPDDEFVIKDSINNTTDLSPVDFRLDYQEYYTSSIVYDLIIALSLPNFLSDPLILGGITGGVMAFGGMTGDMIGSFIKRRSGIPRGKTFVFLDQLGFLVLGMVLVFPIIPWPIEWLLFLVPITFLTHIAANLFGYITGLQDDPL